MSEWECVPSAPSGPAATVAASGESQAHEELLTFFTSHGLGKYAEKLVEVTDAESLEDLRLMDENMATQAALAAGLQIISAKKLQMALASLRTLAPAAPTPLDAAAASDSSTGAQPATAAQAAEEASVPALSAVPNPSSEPMLQECIAICIDRSGSMGSPFGTERSRMEAVKQMFYAFRDRTESVGAGCHQVGVIQFDDKIDVLLGLTAQLDRFEAIVDDMTHRGSTAMFSAISEAVQMLLPVFRASPSTDLRILVLTDGQNNAGLPPDQALQEVNSIGAVVDAIIAGDRPDSMLRRVVAASGGECFQIENLGEGFELLEAERVVSLRTRRGGTDKPAFAPKKDVALDTVQEREMVRGSAVARAPAGGSSAAATARVADAATVVSSAKASSPCSVRVLKEIQAISHREDKVWLHSGEGLHIFPSPDNILLWRALIEGPAGSPFEGGVFALTVCIPTDYPFKPPKIQFETPIYHCGVSDSGNICLDILQSSWSPALSVPKALEAIRLTMGDPDTDYALRQWIAELTMAHKSTAGADTRYVDGARASTLQHASRTVEEWKQMWGC